MNIPMSTKAKALAAWDAEYQKPNKQVSNAPQSVLPTL